MVWIYFAALFCVGYCGPALIESEIEGRAFLEMFDKKAALQQGKKVLANWNYFTNLTAVNRVALTNATRQYIAFRNNQSMEAANYDWKAFKDPAVRRQFEKLVQISPHDNDVSRSQLVRTVTEISQVYLTARVCSGTSKCLTFGRDSDGPMTQERDEEKLLEMWIEWRNATGRKIRDKFTDYVQISNKVAKLRGFRDRSEVWQRKYESKTFEADIKRVYLELRPLYEQLHAYIRRKLAVHYGGTSFPDSGHIPAHLVDNAWRHNWYDIYDLVKPYPEVNSFNVTRALIEKGYHVADLFKMAQDFYTSLGFEPMTRDFWTRSIAIKPKNREMICQPSAFDFSDGEDFRIKMCANVTTKDVIAIHSQMGHTVYHMSYRHQPFLFRNGANPGFHGAMAGLSELSFQTPEHYQILGLTSDVADDNKSDINALMKVALETVASLPFTYLVDQWRWDVFHGKTLSYTYNLDWWRLRCKYQGISPPVMRTEDDFDAGSEHHISSNLPYIQNFVSTILKFQWHKALCRKGPYRQKQLHRCDIFRNWVAGSKLKEMLELGSSRPWPEALQLLTGSSQMSAKALVEYLKPLTNWLANENKGHRIGWDVNCPDNESSVASTMFQSSARTILALALLFVLLL